jgi:hypothetical protein
MNRMSCRLGDDILTAQRIQLDGNGLARICRQTLARRYHDLIRAKLVIPGEKPAF